jgi:hypothetical protein
MLKTSNKQERYQFFLNSNQYPKDLLDNIYLTDPTKSGIYFQWILKQYKKGNYRFPEDNTKYNETLSLFDSKKKRKDFLGQRDINQYQSYGELVRDVKEKQELEYFQKEISNGERLIYKDETYKLIELSSIEALMETGQDTEWCIKNEVNAKSYLQDRNVLYVIYKNNQKYILIDFDSGQYMNVDDEEINEETVREVLPLVEKIGMNSLFFKAHFYSTVEVKNKKEAMFFLRKNPNIYLGNLEEFLEDPEVIQARREGIIYVIKKDPKKWRDYKYEVENDPELRIATKNSWIKAIINNEVFGLDFLPEFLDKDPEVRTTIKDKLRRDCRDNPLANHYLQEYLKDDPELKEILKTSWINYLKSYPFMYKDVPEELKDDIKIRDATKFGWIAWSKKNIFYTAFGKPEGLPEFLKNDLDLKRAQEIAVLSIAEKDPNLLLRKITFLQNEPEIMNKIKEVDIELYNKILEKINNKSSTNNIFSNKKMINILKISNIAKLKKIFCNTYEEYREINNKLYNENFSSLVEEYDSQLEAMIGKRSKIENTGNVYVKYIEDDNSGNLYILGLISKKGRFTKNDLPAILDWQRRLLEKIDEGKKIFTSLNQSSNLLFNSFIKRNPLIKKEILGTHEFQEGSWQSVVFYK